MIKGDYPNIFLNGIVIKHSEQSRYGTVAIGIIPDGQRENLDIMAGPREDKSSWLSFLRHWLTGSYQACK